MSRGYVVGAGSESKLNDVTTLLKLIAVKALEIASKRKLYCPDFPLHGLRTVDEQFQLYKLGRSLNSEGSYLVVNPNKVVTDCDGYNKESAHQSGYAIDYCAYIDGKSNFDETNLALIATCFYEAASDMGVNIEWGGNYRSFLDGCHIEIIRKD